MLVHVGHVLDGGQLAIGHVEEVPSPGEPAEQVPGGARWVWSSTTLPLLA